MCRWLAPIAPSMPSARSRRWAITVNPATASRPTNTSPIVARMSTRMLEPFVASESDLDRRAVGPRLRS